MTTTGPIADRPELKTLMTGIAFGESPRWHNDRLWFCDWLAHEVIAVDLDGHSEVMRQVPTFPFSIDWLPDGRLLVATGKQLQLSEPDAVAVTYADLSSLSNYAWNELAVDQRGNAYVNCVGFDFPGGEFAPGIIALVTSDGETRQVADGLAFPNGMAITPDNMTLIVAESYGHSLTAFDIASDGNLANRRVWADLNHGYPDGICLDAENAVWYADVPNKHCVRVRQGGEVLQTIELDRGCFACALGGPDKRTLFMVAREWNGGASMGSDVRTGQVVITEAPAAGIA
jgi:sugar lactone lactonase YvrE